MSAAGKTAARTINHAGMTLIEASEGLRLEAYADCAGVWTIGYGHTHGVKAGETCTKTEAEQWLGEDIKSAEDAVSRLVKVALTENQFSALVDFTFNEGAGRLETSTLLKKLNEGGHTLVPAYLKAWIFAGGKQQPGLVKRRAAEAALWNEPDQQELTV